MFRARCEQQHGALFGQSPNNGDCRENLASASSEAHRQSPEQRSDGAHASKRLRWPTSRWKKSPAAMRVISSALVVRETGRAARIWHTTHPVHRASRRGALRTERRRGPSGAAMCARGGGQLWHRRPLARRRARRRAAPSARTLRLRDCPCAHGSRGLHRRSGATHTTLRRKPWVIGSRRCPCPLARRWARAQLNTPHGLGIRWGRCPWDGQRRRPKTAADTAGCRWWCQGALKWAP